MGAIVVRGSADGSDVGTEVGAEVVRATVGKNAVGYSIV